ncbi:hypothetical protein R1flu_015967 [Riccia fluitans]|uniref:VWFA domain-containing protein n=1 Tax=Riccia fluitans TaxID=41844 RepID=A0ABD1YKY7_9MARC
MARSRGQVVPGSIEAIRRRHFFRISICCQRRTLFGAAAVNWRKQPQSEEDTIDCFEYRKFEKMEKCCSGIYSDRVGYWLPAESFSADLAICNNVERQILRQTFFNEWNTSVHGATYNFPLGSYYKGSSRTALITGFKCKLGRCTIRGVIRDSNEAEAAAEAMKDGAVKREGNETQGIWRVEIGSIPARFKVEVEITLVIEHALKDNPGQYALRYTLPSKVAPGSANSPGGDEPEWMKIRVSVTMASQIWRMRCISHDKATLSRDKTDACKGYVLLSRSHADALEKDFVLDVYSIMEGAVTGEAPLAVMEAHPSLADSKALVVSLVPRFQMPRSKPTRKEIILMVDTSGAMENQEPELEKALKIFLQSLPVGVKFNVCWFDGDAYEFLWSRGSQNYNRQNLYAAFKFAETLSIHFRHQTDVIAPLEEAFSKRCKERDTEIILLSDGDFGSRNMKKILELVSEGCGSGKTTRVFTLGVCVRRSIYVEQLKNLARAGRGDALIVRNNDRLEAKLVQLLKAALCSHFKDCSIQFPGLTLETDHEQLTLVPRGSMKWRDHQQFYESLPSTSAEGRMGQLDSLRLPNMLTTSYRNSPDLISSRVNVYTILSSTEPIPSSVDVRVTTNSGETVKFSVSVKDVGVGSTLHQLGARRYIEELEKWDQELSRKVGIPAKDKRKLRLWYEGRGRTVGTVFQVPGKWSRFVASEKTGKIENTIHYSHPNEVIFNDDGNYRTSLPSLNQTVRKTSSSTGEYTLEIPPSSGLSWLRFFYDLIKVGRLIFCASAGDIYREDQALNGPNSRSGGEEIDPRESAQKLIKLLMQKQAPDGSFAPASSGWARNITDEIQLLMQVKVSSEEEDDDEGVSATACLLREVDYGRLVSSAAAVIIFQEDLQDLKSVWDLMVEKTEGWGVKTLAGNAAYNWDFIKMEVKQRIQSAKESKQSYWPWLISQARPSQRRRRGEEHLPWSHMFVDHII